MYNYAIPMELLVRYFSEVKGELSKVTWPKRDEVIRFTVIVIFMSLIVGGVAGGLDLGFTKLLEYLLSR